MANGWTPERRARMAELVRTWRPWEHSTGPRSAEGKARSAGNANQGGQREKLRALMKDFKAVLREQREQLEHR